MSKELAFTDDNDVVKYLDTTTSLNLALTADGLAFDLTNAKTIVIKIANDDGYIMDKSIDLTKITNLLNGTIIFLIDQEVMTTLVPDDYDIEVWVTMNDGTQAIFPSDGTLGFSIEENLMSDTGEVIPTITLNDFQQQFNDLSSQMENAVHNVQKGDKGDKGDTGQGLEIKDRVSSVSNLPSTANEGDGYLVNEELYIWVNGAWKDCGPIQGPQGIQGIQGKTGTGVSSTTIQYQISNSATVVPTGTWSNSLIATTQVNPFLWTQVTLNYDDGTSKSFYLVSSKGDKGDKGDTGATGPVGPQGPVGAGLVVKGTVSNASQLPTTGNQEGYCYFVGTDLYVFDAGAWKNCGNVSPDLSNYVTVTDLNNGLSAKVTDNKNGTIQVNGNTITPADDSKVVHTSDTSNWQKQAMFNPEDYKIDETSSTVDFATLVRTKYNAGGVVYIRDSNGPWYASIVDAVVICEGDSWWYAYGVTIDGSFVYRRIRASDDTGWVVNADDSKVAHLSGANNFDTVPTVNSNPLLLASSLPSDLARLGQNQEYTGKNTFDIAPIDKATGNPYITKDGVPAVPSTLADTTKLANFTDGLQKGGKDVATTADVTSAVNSATSGFAKESDISGFYHQNADDSSAQSAAKVATAAGIYWYPVS